MFGSMYIYIIYVSVCCQCRSQWPRGLRRGSAAARLLRFWVRIPPGHGCFSALSVVYCQVEVSATSWSIFQRRPTDCGASLCVWSRNLVNEEFLAHWGLSLQKRTICFQYNISKTSQIFRLFPPRIPGWIFECSYYIRTYNFKIFTYSGFRIWLPSHETLHRAAILSDIIINKNLKLLKINYLARKVDVLFNFPSRSHCSCNRTYGKTMYCSRTDTPLSRNRKNERKCLDEQWNNLENEPTSERTILCEQHLGNNFCVYCTCS